MSEEARLKIVEIRTLLEQVKKKVNEFYQVAGGEETCKELERLSQEMNKEDFWSSPKREEICQKNKMPPPKDRFLLDMREKVKDYGVLLELLEEEGEWEEIEGIEKDLKKFEKHREEQEVKTLFNKEEDILGAYVEINAGAGGTESCDWAEMLQRMYIRFSERQGFSVKVVDIVLGEEAGIKSITLLVRGDFAYGHLKSESGVHRLVRISPFDANKRRHTSFSSVAVIPEIDDKIEVEIQECDLKIDTYRAGGAGGQHVNKTDSAVRITHIPTQIVVQCQSERSQHKNKATAMKMLKSRLYERALEEKSGEQQVKYGEKAQIAWGSQIRSYVFHPYLMVKDHRTNCKVGDALGVIDGKLVTLIRDYLKWSMGSD